MNKEIKMFQCEFCNKTYSSKSNLNVHKKTTKRCLDLRENVQFEQYKCLFCDYYSENKNSIKRHEIICKSKPTPTPTLKSYDTLLNDYENAIQIIEELRKEVAEYRKDMFTLASKPTNHINNTKNTTKTQNLLVADWRPEIIEEKVEENFKLEHVEDGIKGVARFTSQYITHGDGGVKCYQCTDSNREIFMYKDSNGVVQKDIRARKLKDVIKEPILKKTAELSIEEYTRLTSLIKGKNIDVADASNNKMVNLSKKTQEIRDIEDNGDFSKEMAILSL